MMKRSAFETVVIVCTCGLALSYGCSSDDPAATTPGGGDGGGASSTSSTSSSSSSSSSSSGSTGDGGSSSSGGVGIASKYPNDVGIENDPDVIFADGFETYAQGSDLSQKWDNFFQVAQTRIATEPANVKAGAKSLEFTLPKQANELSNAVQKVLTTELDVLYLRYYSKFESTFDVSGSSHNGGGISAHYFVNGNATPGQKADGKNKFLVDFECWRAEAKDKSPGVYNVYVYHPEQRSNYGDHFFLTGVVTPYDPNLGNNFDFGPNFVKGVDITPDLDRWYAHELMVKANTPGMRDGRITLWLDGKQIADFQNLRFRDIDTLKIDRFQLSLHAGNNNVGATKKWYDNVVAAKSYIGPLSP